MNGASKRGGSALTDGCELLARFWRPSESPSSTVQPACMDWEKSRTGISTPFCAPDGCLITGAGDRGGPLCLRLSRDRPLVDGVLLAQSSSAVDRLLRAALRGQALDFRRWLGASAQRVFSRLRPSAVWLISSVALPMSCGHRIFASTLIMIALPMGLVLLERTRVPPSSSIPVGLAMMSCRHPQKVSDPVASRSFGHGASGIAGCLVLPKVDPGLSTRRLSDQSHTGLPWHAFASADATPNERRRADLEERKFTYNVDQALISVAPGGGVARGGVRGPKTHWATSQKSGSQRLHLLGDRRGMGFPGKHCRGRFAWGDPRTWSFHRFPGA